MGLFKTKTKNNHRKQMQQQNFPAWWQLVIKGIRNRIQKAISNSVKRIYKFRDASLYSIHTSDIELVQITGYVDVYMTAFRTSSL